MPGGAPTEGPWGSPSLGSWATAKPAEKHQRCKDQGVTLREVGTFRAEKQPYPRVQQLQMLNNAIRRMLSLLKSCLPVGTEPKAPFVIEVFNLFTNTTRAREK